MSAMQFSKMRVALIVLMSYLALLLHPLLGHTDIFKNFASSDLHKPTVAISAVHSVLDDCFLCHIAGSMTVGKVIADTVFALPDFVDCPVFNTVNPVVSVLPAKNQSRAPPVAG